MLKDRNLILSKGDWVIEIFAVNNTEGFRKFGVRMSNSKASQEMIFSAAAFDYSKFRANLQNLVFFSDLIRKAFDSESSSDIMNLVTLRAGHSGPADIFIDYLEPMIGFINSGEIDRDTAFTLIKVLPQPCYNFSSLTMIDGKFRPAENLTPLLKEVFAGRLPVSISNEESSLSEILEWSWTMDLAGVLAVYRNYSKGRYTAEEIRSGISGLTRIMRIQKAIYLHTDNLRRRLNSLRETEEEKLKNSSRIKEIETEISLFEESTISQIIGNVSNEHGEIIFSIFSAIFEDLGAGGGFVPWKKDWELNQNNYLLDPFVKMFVTALRLSVDFLASDNWNFSNFKNILVGKIFNADNMIEALLVTTMDENVYVRVKEVYDIADKGDETASYGSRLNSLKNVARKLLFAQAIRDGLEGLGTDSLAAIYGVDWI